MERTQDAPSSRALGLTATAAPVPGETSRATDSGSLIQEDAPFVGELLDKWELVSLLGHGGMSQVYRAKHQWLALQAAVKVLNVSAQEQASAQERFHKEAYVLSLFQHENIPQVFDFGISPRCGAYMAQELLTGFELADFMKTSPLPLSWVSEVFGQLCEALRAIHESGLVHRDLKPSNVFLVPTADGVQVKLLDFGVVKVLHGDEAQKLTGTGNIVGTPKYLSPEQIRNPDQVSQTTDLYALGVMLFEALAGEPPYDSDDLMEHLLLITQSVAPLIGKLRPAFAGTQVEALIAELLAKEPTRRPASAADVKRRLQALQKDVTDPVDTRERRAQIERKLQLKRALASGELVLQEQSVAFGRPRFVRAAVTDTLSPAPKLAHEKRPPQGSRERVKGASREKSGAAFSSQERASSQEASLGSAGPSQVETEKATAKPTSPTRWIWRVVLFLCVCLAVVAGRWSRPYLSSHTPTPAERRATKSTEPPAGIERFAAKGRVAFQRGESQTAIRHWMQVVQHPRWRESSYFPRLYRAIAAAHMRTHNERKALHFLLLYKASVVQLRHASDATLRARLPSDAQFLKDLKVIASLQLRVSTSAKQQDKLGQEHARRWLQLRGWLATGQFSRVKARLKAMANRPKQGVHGDPAQIQEWQHKVAQLQKLQGKIAAALQQARFQQTRRHLVAFASTLKPEQASGSLATKLKRWKQRARRGDLLYQQANTAYRKKRWRAAHKLYTTLLKQFPKSWKRATLRKRIKACRCVFGPLPWESCSRDDFPRHYKKRP